MMKKITLLLITVVTFSCAKNKKEEDKTTEVITENKEAIPVEPDGGIGGEAMSITEVHVKTIEDAHKKEEFLKHKAVQFDIDLTFGGKQRLDATITMLTNSSKIRIDKKDNSKLIFDGEKVLLIPSDASEKGARFDMFTWTYFFGLPYKLNDPGTKWELEEMRPLNEVDHQTARLTFDQGTGDAPDDWYVIYSDTKDNILKAAAYIVTYGQDSSKKAEEDPHAIEYKEFKNVENIPFATKWEFYGWTNEKGMTDKLGEATISNITFIEEESSIFEIPEDVKEIKL